jgi:hypothetical protein
MDTTDISSINFNVTIYFSNGQVLQRECNLSKAAKLSMKQNVIIPDDTDYIEVHSVNNSIVIPINMTFVIDASPKFEKSEKISRYMLYKRDHGKCSYCGKEITQKEATIDHITPKSKGGLNVWENLALACKKCNCFKDDRTLKESGMKLLIKPYNPKKCGIS